MTEKECEKLEKTMKEGICKAKASIQNFKDMEVYKKENNLIKAELAQRKGDQNLGYAEGIYQVLVCVGFKHEKMKEFGELL